MCVCMSTCVIVCRPFHGTEGIWELTNENSSYNVLFLRYFLVAYIRECLCTFVFCIGRLELLIRLSGSSVGSRCWIVEIFFLI